MNDITVCAKCGAFNAEHKLGMSKCDACVREDRRHPGYTPKPIHPDKHARRHERRAEKLAAADLPHKGPKHPVRGRDHRGLRATLRDRP